jgi:hypothetical protein
MYSVDILTPDFLLHTLSKPMHIQKWWNSSRVMPPASACASQLFFTIFKGRINQLPS